MPRFLIDVNLPYRFSLWEGDDYPHMRDVGETWTDTQIWELARDRDMVIVSKDADFSDRMMISNPPPRVVHIRFGNMRMRGMSSNWLSRQSASWRCSSEFFSSGTRPPLFRPQRSCAREASSG